MAVLLPVVCCLFTALSGVRAADGSALKFNGTSSRVDVATALVSEDITMSAWVKADAPWINDTKVVISNSYWGAAANRVGFHIMLTANGTAASRYQTQADGVGVWSVSGTTNVVGAWHHLTYVKQGTKIAIIVDGKEEASRNDMPASIAGLAVQNIIRIGCNTSNARVVPGLIDEVRIWNYARSLTEIQESMSHELRGTEAGLVGYWKFNEGQGTTALDSAPNPHHGTLVGATWTTEAAPITSGPVPPAAHGSSPASGAVDVPRDVVLSWRPGGYADKHDIYLGTAFADVDTASRTAPKGVLASQGQDPNTYAPAGLSFGATYYWRIDEVNAPPSTTIIKGSVWSFTVEPYSYPVKPLKATAASAQAGMGPEKTIDGSGLTGDRHGTEPTTMWLSAGAQPNWIQYEFDQVYKLHELQVWNSNQLIESFMGFGARKVTVETSTDGATWTPVANVPEFAQASGAASYAANTTVNLGSVDAKYVKLTIDTPWGGLAPQAGLAEVRFSYVPVLPRIPQPATGAKDISLDTSLDWRPGRQAASHQVYFGTDSDAVAKGTVTPKSVTDHSYNPGSLHFGTTYYWKVAEVNDAAKPGVWEGDVWSFTTREYMVVDDFESYTDEDGSRIYQTWIDGETNKTGSMVGYLQAPFAERTILHGGRQSMPLEYNNVKTPFYSETERTFTPLQNWTVNGADTLSLWFQGRPVAFLDKGNEAFTVSASGHDIWDAADDFRFVYKRLNGNGSILTKVESLVNTNAWAKAGVMIRESLEAASPMAYMIQSFSQGVSFGWRVTQGAGAASVPATAGLAAPRWVKLTRTGNAFTAQHSADGTAWTDIRNADGTVASTTINMAGTVYIGLCVTSHNTAATTTAQFSGAATTGAVTGTWQEVWIGDDPDLTNRAASLYVAIEDSTGKSAAVVHPDPAAAALGAWTQWKVPLSSFTGVNLARVKKLYLGVGDRTQPVKGGAGLVFIDDIGVGHPIQ